MNTSPQIRLTRTAEIDQILQPLKQYFGCLSENEIFKLSLSELYRNKIHQRDENGFTWAEQQEILHAANEASQGKNIDGPFATPKEAQTHLDALKSPANENRIS